MAKADTVTQVNFVKSTLMSMDERDQKIWELITDVPKLDKMYAFGVLFLNVVLPGMLTNLLISILGVGTMLVSIL